MLYQTETDTPEWNLPDYDSPESPLTLVYVSQELLTPLELSGLRGRRFRPKVWFWKEWSPNPGSKPWLWSFWDKFFSLALVSCHCSLRAEFGLMTSFQTTWLKILKEALYWTFRKISDKTPFNLIRITVKFHIVTEYLRQLLHYISWKLEKKSTSLPLFSRKIFFSILIRSKLQWSGIRLEGSTPGFYSWVSRLAALQPWWSHLSVPLFLLPHFVYLAYLDCV